MRHFTTNEFLRQKKCNIELPLIAEIEIFGTFKKIYQKSDDSSKYTLLIHNKIISMHWILFKRELKGK